MAMNMKLWRIGDDAKLTDIQTSSLAKEQELESWIAEDPSLLGTDLLVIGRQVTTGFGGRIDLLGMDAQGDVTVIELKRNRTPRDVTAQVLDYASWVRRLSYKDLDAIASDYLKKDLSAAFSEHFDDGIPENINVSHRMLIVASEFDDSSQRIVEYLAEEYQANINAIFFSVFDDGHGKILGRAWLLDPEDVQEKSDTRKRPPWSGFWFVNAGDGPHRSWNDNVKYGFIGAGHGPKYSGPLKKLKEGDRIFGYIKGEGYVGYGIVREPAKMI